MSKSILVLGAGYAGLRTVRQLQKKNIDATITLVNKNDFHYEATLLHEVAAGTHTDERISFKIKDVIDSSKVNFIQDTVKLINKDENTVTLEKNGTVAYDYLVVALGFESESFGIPGVNEYAASLVDIPTANAALDLLDSNLKKYQTSKDENDLSIVVCGAGFTSIEYLGEITNRLPKLADTYNFPIDKVKITCIEAMPSILPMFEPKLAQYGVDTLERRGVTFITGTPIKEIKDGVVMYEQEGELKEAKASTIIWTTGVRGSSIIGESGFKEGRGRVMVNEDLTAPDYPNIFIIGDVSAVMNPEAGRPYPPTAQIAVVQGTKVAENLELALKGQPLSKFTFKSAGTVASLGNNDAIANVMNKNFKGYIASVMKKGVEDKTLLQLGTMSLLFKKGRFDFYH